jgi:hypothetical protein
MIYKYLGNISRNIKTTAFILYFPDTCTTRRRRVNTIGGGDPMAYALFSVDIAQKHRVGEVLKDDVVSRQSITIRDASALKIDKKVQYILIEGDEEAITTAKRLFEDIGTLEEGAEAEEILAKIRAQDEGAAVGVGFIFGD